MPERDLGALGESILTSWAAARGIKAQRVTQDSTGWDYLLEFPVAPNVEELPEPLDKEGAAISCFVQVKSTMTNKLSFPIKLANWKRFVKNPLPAFFLILKFGLDDWPEIAYLIPVSELLGGQVLKKLRELELQSGHATSKTLSVRCVERGRLAQPDGNSLEGAIREHVGSSLESYIQNKLSWVEKVGYEESTGLLSIDVSTETLNGADLLDCFVDMSLGLRKDLPVKHLTLRDFRFNVPARRPSLEFSEGIFEIVSKPAMQVEVTFQMRNRIARAGMDLFVPSGFAQFLEEKRRKVVLRSHFFSIILKTGSMSMSFSQLAPNSWAPLAQLYDYAAVVLLLGQTSGSTGILEMSIDDGDKSLFKSSMALSKEVDAEQFLSFARIVENAWTVAKYLNIHDRVDICVSSLIQQKERLELFCGLISPKIGEMMVGFREKSLARLKGKSICVPLGTEVMLGEYRCLVVVSVRGILKSSADDDQDIAHVLKSRDRNVVEAYASHTKRERGTTLNAAIRAFADSLDDSVDCLILEQYV